MSRSISPPWISNYVQQRLKTLNNNNVDQRQLKKKEPKVVQVLCVYPEQSSLLISDTVSCIEIYMSKLCREKLMSSFRETGNLKDLKLCQIKIEDFHLSTFVQCASHFDIEAHMRLNKRRPPLTFHCSKITYLGAQDCEKMGSPQEINSCSIVRGLISGVSYGSLYEGLACLQFPEQKQLPDLENKFPVPSEINDENPASVGSFIVSDIALRARVLAANSFEQAEMIRLQHTASNAGSESVTQAIPTSTTAAEVVATAVAEGHLSQTQTFNWVETWTETLVDDFVGTQIDADAHDNKSSTDVCEIIICADDSNPGGKPIVEQSVDIGGTLVDDEIDSVEFIADTSSHRSSKSREVQNIRPTISRNTVLSTQSAVSAMTETLVDTLTETLHEFSLPAHPPSRSSAALGSSLSSPPAQHPAAEGTQVMIQQCIPQMHLKLHALVNTGHGGSGKKSNKRKQGDEEYIGCRVQKKFEGEWYHGTVISCRKVKLKKNSVKSNVLWLIKYEDGDKEEMTTVELKRSIVPGTAPAETAATPSSVVKSPLVSSEMPEDYYINKRVRKMFDNRKLYEGTVTSSRRQGDSYPDIVVLSEDYVLCVCDRMRNGQLWWFITYDDGDEEELSTRMLKRLLCDGGDLSSPLPASAKPPATASAPVDVAVMHVPKDGSHSQNSNGTLPDSLVVDDTAREETLHEASSLDVLGIMETLSEHHTVQISGQSDTADRALHGVDTVDKPVEVKMIASRYSGYFSVSQSSMAAQPVSKRRDTGLLPSERKHLIGEIKLPSNLKLPHSKLPPRSLDEIIRLLYK